jgi:hypothetical protein
VAKLEAGLAVGDALRGCRLTRALFLDSAEDRSE